MNNMTGNILETDRAWEEFFKNVERRALHMARLATGGDDEAFDIVQDAMLGLVKRYRNKPIEELSPLFYRILQNRIRDWHRKKTLQQRWWFWGKASEESSVQDYIDNSAAPVSGQPGARLVQEEAMTALDKALRQLPLRQQQTFLLRAWEGLSVAETASAMKCSTGSVKTHYFRALQFLRETLKDNWP